MISPEENDNSEAFPLPQNLKGVAVKERKAFLDKKATYFEAFWTIWCNLGQFETIWRNLKQFETIWGNANLSIRKLPLNIPILLQGELHILFVKVCFKAKFGTRKTRLVDLHPCHVK